MCTFYTIDIDMINNRYKLLDKIVEKDVVLNKLRDDKIIDSISITNKDTELYKYYIMEGPYDV